MDAIGTHRVALKWAGELLEMVMADVTEEQAHWQPPGIANPLGAQYAHAVCAADTIIHEILQGQSPLFQSSWAGKTGISEPQMAATQEWARSVKVDLAALRPYARAVYAAIEAYVNGLAAEELQRELDLSAARLGVQSVDWILSALVASHINNMAGEISCLKGLQGAKGYPF
jgi:hypothetical protein